MKRIVKYLRHAVLGTMIASKAGASVMVMAPQGATPDDAWGNLRRHLEKTTPRTGNFDFHLPDPASTPDALPIVFETIRNSYLSIEKTSWISLDTYWTDHPKVRTSPVVFQEFLAARSSLQLQMEGSREDIMANWLHNAHHKPGHYDNGGGNDGGDTGGGNGNGNGKG